MGMVPDTAVRAQLIEARENLRAQLIELEGTGRGRGDCRAVYAELQRELSEIDELLGSHDDEASHSGAETAMSEYYPLPSFAAQLRQPKRGIFLIGVGLFGLLWLVFALMRNLFAS